MFEGLSDEGHKWDYSACRLNPEDQRLHFRSKEDFRNFSEGVPEGFQDSGQKNIINFKDLLK